MNILTAQMYADEGVAYIVLPVPSHFGLGLMLHHDLSDAHKQLEADEGVEMAQVAFACGDEVLVLGFSGGSYQQMVEDAEVPSGSGTLVPIGDLTEHELSYVRLRGTMTSGEHLFAAVVELICHLIDEPHGAPPPAHLAGLRVLEVRVNAGDIGGGDDDVPHPRGLLA